MASRRWTFFTAVAIALFFAIYPLYVIRPFRHQGARELAAALIARKKALPAIVRGHNVEITTPQAKEEG